MISPHNNGCITVEAYWEILFSPILQEVFVPVSTCASHLPAAFCWLSLLLLILFFVFVTGSYTQKNTQKPPIHLYYQKFFSMSNFINGIIFF
jgi:hypothetical protein